AVQVALVGCGGRGTGAADQALKNASGPTRLVAMADVFEGKMDTSFKTLKGRNEEVVDVPEDRKFIGFDAYKHAMDALNPGDVVILTTPPAFRWVQFTYAIERGLNVFMEKPVCTDGPAARRMFELNEKAKAKNLKVGVGLMCRHSLARGELFDRIQNGELGDITLLRAYRCAGPTASAFSNKNPGELSDLMYQISRFHSFLWLSGGAFSDFLIHNIDECCWMKNDFPIEAKGFGGRHYRGDYIDQNFDTYTTEYTFADGSKMVMEGRTMSGCHNEFATYVHGSKNSAVCSSSGHLNPKTAIYKGQRIKDRDSIIWKYPDREPNPYQLEWDRLIAAIMNDTPHNEVDRGVKSSLVTAMGRMACHTGQIVTYDEALNHEYPLAEGLTELTLESESPVPAYPDGTYPVPQPGIVTDREYKYDEVGEATKS
ncbi:MAG: Gfo/Idh/MocA family oxidoreductase, partial [Planctomycetaceae bacterium]|nr:Gfo/Idh/MocA family oxidoreductase [Planctomycetaceae bacterium]